jgi:hypothetical protein
MAAPSASEKSANLVGAPTPSTSTSTSTPAPAPAPKIRSCVVCRSRKVRCNKETPCSNCFRANIACVYPSTNRPPRWARRLDRLTNNAATTNAPTTQDGDNGAAKVMERLRKLESLVTELNGQLKEAQAAASPSVRGSSGVASPESSIQYNEAEYRMNASNDIDATSEQTKYGRMVDHHASRSRYVSSGFWSRVNDEVGYPPIVFMPFS